jgi:hypothetical protein
MAILIKLMDVDKDGAIDRKEIEEFMRTLDPPAEKAVEKKP